MLKFGDALALEILQLEKAKQYIHYEQVGQKKKLEKCPKCDDVNSDQFVLSFRHAGVNVYRCSNCDYKALKPAKK